MVQRQLTDSMSVEVGYVGNRGTSVFAGDGPEFNVNQPTIDGFASGVSQNDRRPFYSGIKTPEQNLGGAFKLSQGINYFCNCATNWYDSLQTKLNKRFSDGYQISANYTWQKAKGHSDNYFLWDPNQNYGVQGWNRTNIFNLTLVWELPYGKGRKHGADMSNVMEAILGGWQFNANHTIQSGVPFDVGYNDAGADRDTGTNRPNLIGNADGPKTTARSGSTRRRLAIRTAPSAVRRKAHSATCRTTCSGARTTGALTPRSSSTSGSVTARTSKCG